jgi:hypothetical protein
VIIAATTAAITGATTTAIYTRIMEGLWAKLECRSIHFTLIGQADIQTELETYELHQKIKG